MAKEPFRSLAVHCQWSRPWPPMAFPSPDISRGFGIEDVAQTLSGPTGHRTSQGQRPGGRLPLQLSQERQRYRANLLAEDPSEVVRNASRVEAFWLHSAQGDVGIFRRRVALIPGVICGRAFHACRVPETETPKAHYCVFLEHGEAAKKQSKLSAHDLAEEIVRRASKVDEAGGANLSLCHSPERSADAKRAPSARSRSAAGKAGGDHADTVCDRRRVAGALCTPIRHGRADLNRLTRMTLSEHKRPSYVATAGTL
jgi:hypothetical protein